MMKRLLVGALALGFTLGASQAATAADVAPFSARALDQAQRQGRPILVAVHSEWCGTCKRQVPVITRIAQADAFENLLVLEVDFDGQKDALRQLRAPMQSTLIAYRGRAEVARSVGVSDAEAIAALMERTLEESALKDSAR